MRPLLSTVIVDRPRDEVFAFLDVLANHETFTDHYLVEWEVSGPRTGVGARARMRAALPGPADWIDLRVIEADPPRLIAEESVGARGRRRTRGTYTLEPAPGGGTLVRFELVQLAAPPVERLLAPLLRGWLRRANDRALRRLADRLAGRPVRLDT
jgi:hypothetical protein